MGGIVHVDNFVWLCIFVSLKIKCTWVHIILYILFWAGWCTITLIINCQIVYSSIVLTPLPGDAKVHGIKTLVLTLPGEQEAEPMNSRLSFQKTTPLPQKSPVTLTPATSVGGALDQDPTVLHKLKNSLHDYKTDRQELCFNNNCSNNNCCYAHCHFFLPIILCMTSLYYCNETYVMLFCQLSYNNYVDFDYYNILCTTNNKVIV